MNELRWVVAGLLLIIVDFRVDDVDGLPDPVGWLLALVALARLAGLHGGFRVAAVACTVGLLASLSGWLQAPEPEDWQTTWSVVWETAVIFSVCTAVRALVPSERRRASVLRWWDLGLTVSLLGLVGLTVAGFPAAGVAALAVGLAGFVVVALFLLMLWRAASARDRPAAFRALGTSS